MRICYQSFVDEAHAGNYWDYLRRHLDELKYPDTTIDIRGITPHDSYAHPLVEWRCAREMICNAVRAEREGYDAFIVGHFQDSGLYEARSAVDIPIVALGEASMLYSCQLAQRSAIVTINSRFIAGFHQQIARYGLGQRITQVAAMHFEPGQLLAAFGSAQRTREVVELFQKQSEPLVAAGAELILPGGGIPMLLFANEFGHNVSGAPVVNGIEIAVRMAQVTVEIARRTGLRVSRLADFVKAPHEIIEEFLNHPPTLPGKTQ